MKTVKSASQSTKPKQRTAETPEAREQQLIALAVDCAEERLRNGTASSAEIVHFLRLASSKNELEQEKLRHENELLKAKTAAIEAEQKSEEAYRKVLNAIRLYSGHGDDNEEEL